MSSLTSLTKSTLSFGGKALWVISTSAFLLGVPWALAYAEEEQYVQMEREQGMMKGANEVFFFSSLLIERKDLADLIADAYPRCVNRHPVSHRFQAGKQAAVI